MHQENEIRLFDRHQSMSSETLSSIFDAIKELANCDCPTHQIENMLFGFFDGYDYTEEMLKSSQLSEVAEENPGLHTDLLEICKVVKTYPTI